MWYNRGTAYTLNTLKPLSRNGLVAFLLPFFLNGVPIRCVRIRIIPGGIDPPRRCR